MCCALLLVLPRSAAKVFPAFRAYLQSSPEEEEAKKQALLAELTPINDYLAQEGKVRRVCPAPRPVPSTAAAPAEWRYLLQLFLGAARVRTTPAHMGQGFTGS